MLQGVVPAAGEGSRLRPITFSVPKHLIPLLGKPLIERVISDLASAGVRDIAVVVGYLGYMIREALGEGSGIGVRLSYVVQERRLGIAHAVFRALEEGFLKGPFIVYLGDNLLAGGVAKYVEAFLEGGSDVHILLSRVRDPSRFGVAVVRDGVVVRLVEKPREPVSDLALVGVYMFRDPDLYARAFKSLKPSWRGEYEITDLIQWFIDNGYRVTYSFVEKWWKDVGTPESLLEAVSLLLDGVESKLRGEVAGDVNGRVIVEEGAVVEGRVYGPAYIGRGAYVSRDSVVESYTSLEAGARVESGSLARSLVLERALLDTRRLRLVNSIVGRESVVKCSRELYGDFRVVISDYSYVEL